MPPPVTVPSAIKLPDESSDPTFVPLYEKYNLVPDGVTPHPPVLAIERATVAVPALPVTLIDQVPEALEPAASAAVYPNAPFMFDAVKKLNQRFQTKPVPFHAKNAGLAELPDPGAVINAVVPVADWYAIWLALPPAMLDAEPTAKLACVAYVGVEAPPTTTRPVTLAKKAVVLAADWYTSEPTAPPVMLATDVGVAPEYPDVPLYPETPEPL